MRACVRACVKGDHLFMVGRGQLKLKPGQSCGHKEETSGAEQSRDFNGDCELGIQPASRTSSVHHFPLPLSSNVRAPRMCSQPRRLGSTPSPWGGGLSNTDVALINWAQHSEVGLETTWQFPAAPSLLRHISPPAPTPSSRTPPSLPPRIWIT